MLALTFWRTSPPVIVTPLSLSLPFLLGTYLCSSISTHAAISHRTQLWLLGARLPALGAVSFAVVFTRDRQKPGPARQDCERHKQDGHSTGCAAPHRLTVVLTLFPLPSAGLVLSHRPIPLDPARGPASQTSHADSKTCCLWGSSAESACTVIQSEPRSHRHVPLKIDLVWRYAPQALFLLTAHRAASACCPDPDETTRASFTTSEVTAQGFPRARCAVGSTLDYYLASLLRAVWGSGN